MIQNLWTSLRRMEWIFLYQRANSRAIMFHFWGTSFSRSLPLAGCSFSSGVLRVARGGGPWEAWAAPWTSGSPSRSSRRSQRLESPSWTLRVWMEPRWNCRRWLTSLRTLISTQHLGPRFPRAACLSAPLEQARRSWPRQLLARLACHSSLVQHPSLLSSLSVWVLLASVTCSRRPRPRPRASSLLMRLMLLGASVVLAWAEGMMNGSKLSTSF
mmetsp:Transcript_39136/g.99150  ORF Transcript_39136/g.99150 Transcript_39136/m.99150 type:complete len:214 (-) Transcript_39136:1171-1812(-)